jgi:hypothetical protein
VALFGTSEEGMRVAWRRPQRRDDFGPAVRTSRRDFGGDAEGGFGDSTAGSDGALMGAGGTTVDEDIPF